MSTDAQSLPLLRSTPLDWLERWASWFRNLPGLRGFNLLWKRVRPVYGYFLDWRSPQGIEWFINGEPMRLSFCLRAVSHVHEPNAWNTLVQATRPGDTVVDIGANVGLYTIALGRRVGPLGRVLALEPDPSNFRLLRKHLNLNALDSNVHAHPVALGSTERALRFNKAGAFSSVSKNGGIRVACTRLDQALPDTCVDVMKIDTEGFEEPVLRGASLLFKDRHRRPRLVYLEIHPNAWKELGLSTTLDGLVTWFSRHGYTLRNLGWVEGFCPDTAMHEGGFFALASGHSGFLRPT